MNSLIDVALRPSVILLTGLCVRTALKRTRGSAALRHFVVASALAGAVAVIPLRLVLPSWTVSLPVSKQVVHVAGARPPAPHAVRAGVADTAGTSGTQDHRSTVTLARVWLAGLVVFATSLAVGVLRLVRTAQRAANVSDAVWLKTADAVARAYGVRRRVALLQTSAPDVLATCGILRPRVLLPSHATQWPRDRIHVVLCHELAHVRRFDWAVQIGGEIARAILWFNPLVWIACTCLRRDGEHACDDLVLGRGVDARAYATHLLELARKCRRAPGLPLPVTSMARRSTLERRIADMLNSRLDRGPLSIRTLGIASALLVAASLPAAALRAAHSGPATLSGTVYDTTGGVIPGAAITLEDATQMTYTATTDRVGRFAFSNVQPGHYTLEASQPGFKSLRQEFDLTASRDWDRAITLQVGTLRETITVSERRTAAPAPAATSTGKVRVGGSVRAPLKIRDVRPVYPTSMREAGREGIVPIEATIGTDGTVTSVRVLSADVHPDFAVAAVDAVRQWGFTPTLLNGSPVEVVMTVSVAFTLSDR